MKKANIFVMTIAGLVLIAATILKIHQVLTEPIITPGFWESWLFLIIQIPLELALGIWLVSALFRKAAWLTGTICYAAFIILTLYKAVAGYDSCGCFGTVHVNPWITLAAVDVPIFIALALFPPKGKKLLPPPWPHPAHFFAVAIPSAVIIAALVPTLVFNKPPQKTEKYEVVNPQDWQNPTSKIKSPADPNSKSTSDPNDLIDPDTTAAPDANTPKPPAISEQLKPDPNAVSAIPQTSDWEMYQYIDIADQLKTGIVVVVFYHDDCEHCQEAIPRYDENARQLGSGPDAIQFAFIEIPPYGQPEDSIVPNNTPCMTGKLSNVKKWYITSPLTVLLLDGNVIKTWEIDAPQYEQFLNKIFNL